MNSLPQTFCEVNPEKPETILSALNDLNEIERKQEQAVRNILGPCLQALDDIERIFSGGVHA